MLRNSFCLLLVMCIILLDGVFEICIVCLCWISVISFGIMLILGKVFMVVFIGSNSGLRMFVIVFLLWWVCLIKVLSCFSVIICLYG